MRKRLMD